MRGLPPFVETEDMPKKKLDRFYRPPTPELIAYLDFSVSTTGVLSGVKVKEATQERMIEIYTDCSSYHVWLFPITCGCYLFSSWSRFLMLLCSTCVSITSRLMSSTPLER